MSWFYHVMRILCFVSWIITAMKGYAMLRRANVACFFFLWPVLDASIPTHIETHAYTSLRMKFRRRAVLCT